MKTSIHQQFKKLLNNYSQSENCYTAVDIPFSKSHKLGIGNEGYPMFFIKSSITGSVPNINLEFITVQFNELCKLKKSPDQKTIKENYYTVVSLKTDQTDYVEYFLDVVCIVLQKIGDAPSQQDLMLEMQKLVELFRRFSAPPMKTMQGLWAELFVIEQSSNPEYLVKSWHRTASDVFDFNDGIDKIEVKSTSKVNRVHKFSHNQLNPNEGSNVIIASICIQQSGIGKTIFDMKEAIDSRINSIELRFLLVDMISKTLGADFEKANECTFDYTLACDTYQVYNCKDIPSIANDVIPAEISNIHYDSDLSGISPIDNLSKEFPTSELFKSL